MLQLVVYAGMQIPVGLLVDRFGSRSVLLCGTVILTVAQAGVLRSRTATPRPGRAAVRRHGRRDDVHLRAAAGEQLVPDPPDPARHPAHGHLGQLGAVLAAVPMTWALGSLGWTKAYLVAASIGLVLAVAVLVVLHGKPDPAQPARTGDVAHHRAPQPRRVLGAPGTRLGFWMHFSHPVQRDRAQPALGLPFFVGREHQSDATAGVLLTLMVLAVMAAGRCSAGWSATTRGTGPRWSLTIVSAIVVTWTAVLAWPGHAPTPLLVVLVLVVGVGGPASMIGSTSAAPPTRRSGSRAPAASSTRAVSSPARSSSSRSAWCSTGAHRARARTTPSAFRWAMATQYLIWALGLSQVYRYRQQASGSSTGARSRRAPEHRHEQHRERSRLAPHLRYGDEHRSRQAVQGDVVDLILDDHRRFRGLLRDLRDSSQDRDAVRRAFATLHVAHAVAGGDPRLPPS